MRAAPKWSEQRLWQVLRGHRCGGLKFRRQAPIGPYVADFVCFHPRLVVEVDGGIHRLCEERDAARDAWFVRNGFRVLRFKAEHCAAAPGTIAVAILETVGLHETGPLGPLRDQL